MREILSKYFNNQLCNVMSTFVVLRPVLTRRKLKRTNYIRALFCLWKRSGLKILWAMFSVVTVLEYRLKNSYWKSMSLLVLQTKKRCYRCSQKEIRLSLFIISTITVIIKFKLYIFWLIILYACILFPSVAARRVAVRH